MNRKKFKFFRKHAVNILKVSISLERKSKLGQIQSNEILKEQLNENLKSVHDVMY